MNASVEEVEQGSLLVEAWKMANSREMVEAAANEQTIIALEPIGQTLAEAQRATRIAVPPVYSEEGDLLVPALIEPDHTIRIEAVKATATVISAVREKGPAVSINNQIGIGVGMGGGGGPKSFEARVRERQEQRKLLTAHAVVMDRPDVMDDDEDGEREGEPEELDNPVVDEPADDEEIVDDESDEAEALTTPAEA